MALPDDVRALPDAVSEALAQLRQAGVGGPYALALGPPLFEALDSAITDSGYPVKKHVQRLIDGPLIWASALRGGLVASLRGGDFKLVCGRDASVGYLNHDEKTVRLYLEESFTFELDGPEAVAPLLTAEDGRDRDRRK